MPKIVIHAETAVTEGQQIYEGENVNEAASFLADLEEVTVIQCNLSNKLANGEMRSMSRSAKADAAESLTEDIKSWLRENAGV